MEWKHAEIDLGALKPLPAVLDAFALVLAEDEGLMSLWVLVKQMKFVLLKELIFLAPLLEVELVE